MRRGRHLFRSLRRSALVRVITVRVASVLSSTAEVLCHCECVTVVLLALDGCSKIRGGRKASCDNICEMYELACSAAVNVHEGHLFFRGGAYGESTNNHLFICGVRTIGSLLVAVEKNNPHGTVW